MTVFNLFIRPKPCPASRPARELLLLLALALFLAAAIQPAQADFFGRVTHVIDGDTLRVLRDGRSVTVRLHGIDCPEMKKRDGEKSQPFARKAWELAQGLAHQQDVQVLERGMSGGRIVGIVILPGGRVLNEELLRQGLAWWYHLYNRDAAWAALETKARAGRKGLWRDPLPVPPWVFRHKQSLERENKL
jgi:endonuclease YncB( thermonuclease family)